MSIFFVWIRKSVFCCMQQEQGSGATLANPRSIDAWIFSRTSTVIWHSSEPCLIA